MALLEIYDLAVHYGEINALKGVSLQVQQGDFITLIGANGAGKTTLLNTLTGVVKSSGGDVFFQEENITDLPSHEIVKKGICHVPEGRKIFSELTVEENLFAGAFIQRDKQKIHDLMEQCYALFPRLAERRKQEGGTLSGGEQQMLAIARGMMSDPEILLLDEPSLGLAPIIVEKIFEFIVNINRLGKSILLVEQNANLALQVASYGYVLETGSIIMEAETSVLRTSDLVQKAYLGIA
ncbi:branched-chain amino acid ABC transporter, ATP-binding protein [Candidatus Vecturithrix granuli]|uniref:Branched-chain amino acid ABC transporter, ATP-binding protein n=1 Tax=Vecturithrix granuli TaxID=1499967 RepID=A0A081BTY7_VECG1|nr:branched-chain amino acid ABC transporter, ATP-binding protein [Candidatus Vecturithrix granuli]